MAAHAEAHAALQTCGITVEAERNTFVNIEGFQTLADIGSLSGDADAHEMVKRMGSRTVADGRVVIGTITVKKLQALVYWTKDRQKRQQALAAADFTDAALQAAMRDKEVEKNLEDVDMDLIETGK